MSDVKFLFLVRVQYNVKFYGKTFNDNYTHKWELKIVPVNNLILDSVTFILHESFPNRERKFTKPPYKVKESGYGTFEMNIKMNMFGKTYSEVYDIVLFQDAPYKSLINYFVLSRKISSKHFQLALENGGIPVPDDYLRDNKSMSNLKEKLSANGHDILPQNYFRDLYKYVTTGISVVTKRLSEDSKESKPISNSKLNFNDQKSSSSTSKNKHHSEISDVNSNSSSQKSLKKRPNPQIAGRKIIKSDSNGGSYEDISTNSQDLQRIASKNSNKCGKNVDRRKISRNDSDSSDIDAEDIFRKSAAKLDMLMQTGFGDTDKDDNAHLRSRNIRSNKGVSGEFSNADKRNRVTEKSRKNIENEIDESYNSNHDKERNKIKTNPLDKPNCQTDERNPAKDHLIKENQNNRKSFDVKTDSRGDEKFLNLSTSYKKIIKKKDFVLNDESNLKNELHSFNKVEAHKQNQSQKKNLKAFRDSTQSSESYRPHSNMSKRATANENTNAKDKTNKCEDKSNRISPKDMDNLTERDSSLSLQRRSNPISDNCERTVNQAGSVGPSSSDKSNSMTNIFSGLKIKKKSTVFSEENCDSKKVSNKNELGNKLTTQKTDKEEKYLTNTSNEDCNDVMPKVAKSSGEKIKQTNVTMCHNLDSDLKKLSHGNLDGNAKSKFFEIDSTKANSHENAKETNPLQFSLGNNSKIQLLSDEGKVEKQNLSNCDIFEPHSEKNSRESIKNIKSNKIVINPISSQSKFTEVPHSQSNNDNLLNASLDASITNKPIKMKMIKNNSFVDNSSLIHQNIFESNDEIKTDDKCNLRNTKIPKKAQSIEVKAGNSRNSQRDSSDNLNSNLESSKNRKTTINDKRNRSRSESRRERSNSSSRQSNSKQTKEKPQKDSSEDNIQNIDSFKNHNSLKKVSQSVTDLARLDSSNRNLTCNDNKHSNQTSHSNLSDNLPNSNNSNGNLESEQFSHKIDSGKKDRKIAVPKSKISIRSYLNRTNTNQNPNDNGKKDESCKGEIDVKDTNGDGKTSKPLSDNADFVGNCHNIDKNKPSDSTESRDPELTDQQKTRNPNKDENIIEIQNEQCNNSQAEFVPSLLNEDSINTESFSPNNFDKSLKHSISPKVKSSDEYIEQQLICEDIDNCSQREIADDDSQSHKSIHYAAERQSIDDSLLDNCRYYGHSEAHKLPDIVKSDIDNNLVAQKIIEDPISDHDDVASDHDVAPSDHDDVASDHDDVASNHDDVASDNDVAPSDHNDVASNHDDVASNHDDDPSDHDDVASDHDDVSSNHDVAPSDHDDVASNHDVASSDHDDPSEEEIVVIPPQFNLAEVHPDFVKWYAFQKSLDRIFETEGFTGASDQVMSNKCMISILRLLKLDTKYVGKEFTSSVHPVFDTSDLGRNIEPNLSEERNQMRIDISQIKDTNILRSIRDTVLWFLCLREPGIKFYRVASGFVLKVDYNLISEDLFGLLSQDVKMYQNQQNL